MQIAVDALTRRVHGHAKSRAFRLRREAAPHRADTVLGSWNRGVIERMKLRVSNSTYALSPQVLRRVRQEMKQHAARLGKRIPEGPATVLVPMSGNGQLSVEYDAGAHLPLAIDVVADKRGRLRLAPGRRGKGRCASPSTQPT